MSPLHRRRSARRSRRWGSARETDRHGLRKRYSTLVRRYHPDRNGGDRSHEARLQRVVEAYQLLRKAAAFAVVPLPHLVFRPPARVFVRGAHHARLARDHFGIEPLDRAAAGALEQRRDERVGEAGDAARDHRQPEAGGGAEVLGIGLADAARVLGEPSVDQAGHGGALSQPEPD